MLKNDKTILLSFVLLFVLLFFNACSGPASLIAKLKNWNDKVGDMYINFNNKQVEKLVDDKATTTNLSQETKQKIDEWLLRHNLNKFGDTKNRVYTGGTPLFNEKTGETKDRFEYLLEKYPNLLEKIKK